MLVNIFKHVIANAVTCKAGRNIKLMNSEFLLHWIK